jgi:hypothetical protein
LEHYLHDGKSKSVSLDSRFALDRHFGKHHMQMTASRIRGLIGHHPFMRRLVIFAAVFAIYVLLERHIPWLNEWRGFLGACYIWTGTTVYMAYWSGLFSYQKHHPEKRFAVFGELALAILLPLGVMFLLHYLKYVPLTRTIGGYLVGTLALAPMALRFLWRWNDGKPPRKMAGCPKRRS